MFEANPLLDEIIQNPANDEARWVYADWLEERGDLRAEFLRSELEITALDIEDCRRSQLLNKLTFLIAKITNASDSRIAKRLIKIRSDLPNWRSDWHTDDWIESIRIRYAVTLQSYGRQRNKAIKLARWLSGDSTLTNEMIVTSPWLIDEDVSLLSLGHFNQSVITSMPGPKTYFRYDRSRKISRYNRNKHERPSS